MCKLSPGLENTLHISVLITTLNAANTIERVIESLKFAKEIIIIDSFSSDDTIKLLSKYDNVTTYQKEFTSFTSQQQYAISKASCDWILFLNQNEEFPENVSQEILETKYISDDIIFVIKKDSCFMGRKMKGNLPYENNDALLFNKNKYNSIKNALDFIDDSKHTIILNNLLPFYTTLDDYTGKMHHQSTLEAKTLYYKKKKPSFIHFFVLPFFEFWKQYLFRLLLLDGKEGFILSYITAFTVFKKHINLWLMYRKIR
ncbi:glycosyltransferase family 2 protein [Aquimarina sp. 2201CG1-2-11]|uniref:glycosyltransferase family 2 protein n=1 Tax=Aquimarina discodermiae TaxID=3231043 RepID=UPI003462D5D1